MTSDPPGDLPDNRLFEWYREYIGEPDAETDVYLGFGLFFAAIGFGLLLLGVVVIAHTLIEIGSARYHSVMQVGYVLGLLSLPMAMIGITVLLPVDRRATYAAAAGGVVTLAGTAAFVYAYPFHWYGHGEDYSVQVVATYAVGLVVVIASTASALIGHHLAQAKPHPSEIDPVEEDDLEESYTDEEIQRDIEEAMADVEMSWGGVEKHESKSLQFTIDDTFDGADVDVEATTTRQEGGVDAQVSGLKQLKGGQAKTESSSSTVDDQTAKLTELRERKRQEEAASDADGGLLDRVGAGGLLERFRNSLRRLRQ